MKHKCVRILRVFWISPPSVARYAAWQMHLFVWYVEQRNVAFKAEYVCKSIVMVTQTIQWVWRQYFWKQLTVTTWELKHSVWQPSFSSVMFICKHVEYVRIYFFCVAMSHSNYCLVCFQTWCFSNRWVHSKGSSFVFLQICQDACWSECQRWSYWSRGNW